MGTTAADVLVEGLENWGVEVVFGLPGDGINAIMEAFRVKQDRIRFIQVRHEESAAFMACAYAKYTGRLGVCVATSGPGGLHLINGLYDAKLDGQPVLAITGLPFHDLIGSGTQQDVQLDRVFADVAAFNERIMGPAHVENMVDQACRTAIAFHTVAHLAFPLDLQEAEATSKGSKRNIPGHTSQEVGHGAGLPAETSLRAAAELLNAGSRVAILAGRGALGAGAQLEAVAEALAAPVIKPLLGKAVLPDDSPYTTGGIGLLGTGPSQEAMESCDTLLIVGSTFPYIEFYPQPGQAKCVQIDRDPSRIGLRYPADIGLAGDTGRSLEALLPLLQRKSDRGFLEQAQQNMERWRVLLEKQETREDTPLKPQVVARAISRRLADDAIISADSGTNTIWAARHIEIKAGQMFSTSGTLASMGNALPYTIAAQLAHPDRQCVAIVGDGGLSMTMAEMATAVKYELPVRVVVFKNNSLGMIKWEQMVFLGNPEYACDLQPIDFAAFARACGAEAYSVDDPAALDDVLDRAFAVRGPVLIEASIDPLEPPLPPKVTPEQALHFAKALARGEPNREKIALTVISDRVRQMI
ncbi:MAG: thiamine pyrophosphate-dependent enzyme [Dehalococcoidia bacterium]